MVLLNEHVILEIALYLDVPDLLSLALVSRHFRQSYVPDINLVLPYPISGFTVILFLETT